MNFYETVKPHKGLKENIPSEVLKTYFLNLSCGKRSIFICGR
ncbi:hypothetical protein NEICINOT_04894 [Neisseria cinerea ATCC 14685]|uniref:Uncharacterized protein n=1 Tax=Neisseria cinerea ATCC 14685 TaxID=546262 RepID=D0W5D9_NEICI|nr:hypothetical protein NEICINOT_04894 [Neisseria cinerea ATCC 14685]